MKITVHDDPERCQYIWEKLWPVKGLFDLWEVRSCFHDVFARPLHFQTAERDNEMVGFLPLSWHEQANCYIPFPGETWQGRTWIEQNKIIAQDSSVLHALLDEVPGSLELRYLDWNPLMETVSETCPDETGYLFFPGICDFSFENYWLGFSGKTRKKMKTELKKFEDQGVSFRYNHCQDIERMFQMNVDAFPETSYFSDAKFHHSFERLVSYLWKMGMLRVTSVLVNGEIAAVDIGAVFKNTYTLLAGGTHPGFPGVAKFINLHHLKWACKKQFDMVDFLCGDFNWKERFHLSPRVLYGIQIDKSIPDFSGDIYQRESVCA